MTAVGAGGRSLTVTGLRDGEGLQVDRFVAHGGEVVGVTGLTGAGAERFFELLFGVRSLMAGRVELPHGRPGARSIRDAVDKKVAFIPSDRKRLGLVLQQSIADNVAAVRALVAGQDGFVLKPGKSISRAQQRCGELAVKCASVHQPVGELSGGNQQKVVFAKWLEAEPDLLLLDDPTRGVDIGAKHEVYAIVRRLASEGRVILMNSSDPDELIQVCDRIEVFFRGRVLTSLSTRGLTEHRLIEAMNGVLVAA
jgi:ribose transport system ATP-binding protein